MNYKVTEKDLKGKIKGFPIEVVQKMVDYQVEQGNKADVSVFQIMYSSNKDSGGFAWDKTEEGRAFWRNVLDFERLDVFFKKYPKK